MATIYIPKPDRLVELLEQVRRIADELAELAEVAPSSLHGMACHPKAGGRLTFEWRGKNVQD